MSQIKMQPEPEIISREIIKPYSPPSPNDHPKTHNLSLFDQIPPPIYVPLLFFYTSKNDETGQRMSSLLKTSLFNVLFHYYPVAGRVRDNFVVDCNDNGIELIEAKLNCELCQVLRYPRDESLRLLIPKDPAFTDSIPMDPLVVQATFFTCGGLSLGFRMCHKLFDMSSFCTFMNDWASIARKSGREVRPVFDIGSSYPSLDPNKKQLLPSGMKDDINTMIGPYLPAYGVLRRLVFSGEKIAELKEKVGDVVTRPTRAEAVTALLYKTVVKAAAKANPSGSMKPSVMMNAVNLRALVRPPLSEQNIGNMGYVFQVGVREEEELGLGFLVKEYRKSKARFSDSFSNKEELVAFMLKSLESAAGFSSVENEVYEVDFGWGKPAWFAVMNLKNSIILYNTREGDGIEVFMSLEEKVMALFQQDEELLSFCRTDPSVMPLESRL